MTKGKLFVLSAPSGCGKTTIAKAILAAHPEFLFSISATTRQKRNGEIDGKDYFFLSREEFEARKANGDLVEWEEIYGNYYGTLRSEVVKALEQNKPMIFDIDVKGALSIRKHFPHAATLIFIAPPSIEELRARLLNRKTETPETLQRRMERVAMELEMQKEFDYVVVNDDLQRAIAEVETIIAQQLTRDENNYQ